MVEMETSDGLMLSWLGQYDKGEWQEKLRVENACEIQCWDEYL